MQGGVNTGVKDSGGMTQNVNIFRQRIHSALSKLCCGSFRIGCKQLITDQLVNDMLSRAVPGLNAGHKQSEGGKRSRAPH